MKKWLKYNALLFAWLVASISVQAQNDEVNYGLVLEAQAYGDSVVLRWVPNHFLAWQAMNKYGVIIERTERGVQDSVVLTNNPVLPFTLKQWKNKTDTTNVHVATAAQCLLGETIMQADQAQSLSQKLLTSQEQQNRLALAAFSAEFSIEAATGLAMRYLDDQVKTKANYTYRVRLARQPKNHTITLGTTRVNTAAVWQPRAVVGVRVENGDGKVTLKWPKAGNNANFSGYYIERSDDNGKTFKQMNEAIYKSMSSTEGKPENEYTDELETYNKDYLYRVVGITSFADRGLYSNTFTG